LNEFTFRLNDGNVKAHTINRLNDVNVKAHTINRLNDVNVKAHTINRLNAMACGIIDKGVTYKSLTHG